MTKGELEKLGWKFESFWNNRAFHELSKGSKYPMFEHDGWGIMDPYKKEFSLIYCNMTDEEITSYTSIVDRIEVIENHPKDYSLYEYQIAKQKLLNFITKMKERA